MFSSQQSLKCWCLESSAAKGRIQAPKQMVWAHLRCLWAHVRFFWDPSKTGTFISRNAAGTSPAISASWCFRYPGIPHIARGGINLGNQILLKVPSSENWVAFHPLLTAPASSSGSLDDKCRQPYDSAHGCCLNPKITFSSAEYPWHQKWSDMTFGGN